MKYTQIPTLQNLHKIQNINYGTYTKYKIKNWAFEDVRCFRNVSNLFPKIESILALLAYFVKVIIILNIGFGFVVLNSICEHGLKVYFEIF